MRLRPTGPLALLSVFLGLLLLHAALLRLPYFWDEAGYYVPAALDFYRSGLLIPTSTLPTGHTPLVTVYLALAWKLFGFSPLVTRAAMLFIAAATLVAVLALARRLLGREVAVWSAIILALSPLYFAQSSLAHLDLAAGLFTTLAVLALVERRLGWFALAASLAILSKETAVALLPVAWAFAWRERKTVSRLAATLLAAPLAPLLAWAIFYHHSTGFWTGNPQYLEYNLYSTLTPGRFLWSLLRRLDEVFVAGFNWVLAAGAVLGFYGDRGKRESRTPCPLDLDPKRLRDFYFLSWALLAIYLLMLSLVGGAILPRYLLAIFPVFYLLALTFVIRLPKPWARTLCVATAAAFVAGWFLNPPYPFPYEDNLAYADFVRLHQSAANYLERAGVTPGVRVSPHQIPAALAGEVRVLTAWPATDELTRPFLGYVSTPLRVVPLEGFASKDFGSVSDESFDLLYLYSRKWEPPGNWLARWPGLLSLQERYFDYAPQVSDSELISRYHLRLLEELDRRGQWVRIYAKKSRASGAK